MIKADSKPRVETGGVAFSECSSAARYANLRELLPAKAAAELPSYLAVSGDPDRAVLQMEVLLQRHPADALAAFAASSLALRAAVALFAASQWLGQTLLQNPDLMRLFARPGGLAAASLTDDFRERFARFHLRFHDLPLVVLLARFKRREYVRIFVRELLGLASLPEIAGEISALSDVLIEQALSHCESELQRRYGGWPQLRSKQRWVYPASFVVLSLGKLGGKELNYSSDIDLLYLYDDGEDSGAIAIPAREFFTRLAQELTEVLSGVSSDGQVFRVDLRLRPQGASGEMVAGCAQALRYYRSVAQDWELQALLKVRCSAGEAAMGREFVEQLQELIYCNELSLSAVKTAAQSLERIQRGATRQGAVGLDVKSGRGGLREIEFAVQCLQRVHGKGEPWLRSSGTLFALQKLHDKGHIGDAEFGELGATYTLLRAIEHRLQCRQGAQLHRLPQAEREQAAVFASIEGWTGGVAELKRRMKSASDLCARVLRLGAGEEKEEITASSLSLGEPGSERLRRELAGRSPALAQALDAEVGDATLRGLGRFLAAASTGERRRRKALEQAEWIERALPVFARSALANSILSCHPEDIGALFRRCEVDANKPISDRLRIEARRSMLRAVGRSILEAKPVWKTLRGYSQSLDRILGQALSACDPPAKGFAVFAVGRLGTCELDVMSDADLVFLHNTECDAEQAGRCALAMVGLLSDYTREGSVIEVDTRLRPHGSEGSLVTSMRQLAQYFESGAHAWEALVFAKMRWVAGDSRLVEEAGERLAALRRRFARSPRFAGDLRAMRKRIAEGVTEDSFKAGPGGLYDLDFIAGMLEAREGLQTAGNPLPERLDALRERALLTEEQAAKLLSAAELFRRVEHAVRVVEGRSRKWLPESDELRKGVERLAGRAELDGALRAEMQRVRGVFDLLLGD